MEGGKGSGWIGSTVKRKGRAVLGIGNTDFPVGYRRGFRDPLYGSSDPWTDGLPVNRYADLTKSVNFLVFQEKPGSALTIEWFGRGLRR